MWSIIPDSKHDRQRPVSPFYGDTTRNIRARDDSITKRFSTVIMKAREKLAVPNKRTVLHYVSGRLEAQVVVGDACVLSLSVV